MLWPNTLGSEGFFSEYEPKASAWKLRFPGARVYKKAVDAVFDGITASLKAGGSVAVLGFGSFSVAARAARIGRNPRTGAEIKIAASRAPTFKAGKGLKDAVSG